MHGCFMNAFGRDNFAEYLGLEVVEAADGRAIAKLEVRGRDAYEEK